MPRKRKQIETIDSRTSLTRGVVNQIIAPKKTNSPKATERKYATYRVEAKFLAQFDLAYLQIVAQRKSSVQEAPQKGIFVQFAIAKLLEGIERDPTIVDEIVEYQRERGLSK